MHLNDRDLVLLSAAAQRPDHLLARPEGLSDGALRRLSAKLLRVGAVEEVAVERDAPCWSEDEHQQRSGLRIAASGLDALGITDGAVEADGERPAEADVAGVASDDPHQGSPAQDDGKTEREQPAPLPPLRPSRGPAPSGR